MKRKVTIYLEPIEKEITLDDNLSEDEIIDKKWERDYPQAHMQYPCDINTLLDGVRATGKIDAYKELLEEE